MDIIFMNFENRKTSDPHGLILDLTDKINLVALSTLLYMQKYKRVIQKQ